MLVQLRICLTQSLLVRTHPFLIPQFLQTTSLSTPMKYRSCWITWSFTACDTERVPGGCVAWVSKLLRCQLATFCSCNKGGWKKCPKVRRVRSSRTWSTNLETVLTSFNFAGGSKLLHSSVKIPGSAVLWVLNLFQACKLCNTLRRSLADFMIGDLGFQRTRICFKSLDEECWPASGHVSSVLN